MLAYRHTGVGRGAALVAASLLCWSSGVAAQSRCGRITTVRSGETLDGVASRCGVTVQDILRKNYGLEADEALRAGIQLLLPVDDGRPVAAPAARADPRVPPPAAPARSPLPGVVAEAPRRDPADVRADAALRARRDRALGEARIDVRPRTAQAGARLRVRAVGFEGNERVVVGLVGHPDSPMNVLTNSRTNARGMVSVEVLVPDWVEAGRDYAIAVAADERVDRVVSAPFTVQGQPGEMVHTERPDARRTVNLEGELLDGGVDCQGMRDTQGRLWSLTGGDLARFPAGERVLVRGTVPDVSVCVRGTALQVDHIERIPTDPLGAARDERVRLTGTVERGNGCTVLRTAEGTAYALTGDLGALILGSQVTLETVRDDDVLCPEAPVTVRVRRVLRR